MLLIEDPVDQALLLQDPQQFLREGFKIKNLVPYPDGSPFKININSIARLVGPNGFREDDKRQPLIYGGAVKDPVH